MNWLGGPHDGYCRSTSPTAYVWIRLHAARSPREYIALWQSALTFGVLETITGFAIPEHLLLSTMPDGSLVFTKQAVSRLVTTWLSMYSVERGHDDTRNSPQLDHAWETVAWALLAIDEVAKDLDRGIFGDAELATYEAEDIVCSLFTLYEFLYHYFVAILLHTQKDTERYQQRPCPPCTAADEATKNACSRRMANGWCPYTLRLLASINNQLLLRASFSPPHLRTPTEHAACTKDGCVGDNIDAASYTTQHTPQCADPTSCPFLKPSLSAVVDRLSSGAIPVIVYEHGTLTVRSAADGPYTAISHVWADGLGSTTEEGLPECQIPRIAAHVRQLKPGGAFWVDSLCVPAVKDLRKRAIRLMAETYERAAAVVVFDAGIRAYCTSATAPRDVFMRITASSWMRRVWTLQEALLARELHFEFSDGLYIIDRLVDARSAAFEPTPSAFGPIQRDLSAALCCTGNLTSIMDRGSRAFSFPDVASMLTGRTTSHPEDETVAVAGLLGVDVARLLAEQDADARMRVFLEETKTLPADVLFSPAPKLPFRGFRWAARTLRSLHEMSSRHGAARCTTEGLATEQAFTLVRFPVTRIGADEEAPPIIVADTAKSKTYVLSPNDKTRVRGMALAPNAIVAPRGALELLSGDLDSARWVNAVCVHVPGPPHDSPIPNGPVRCEYLFHVVMSVFETSPLSLEGQLTPPEAAALFSWPHVELQSITANQIVMV
ncbi:hypothetical protein C8Q80DRAFT_375197 [Daedaleopsis nitida]|nr:hypothetical protein C8Q80DRAFT_375197 [Daedaleopsis nitida]